MIRSLWFDVFLCKAAAYRTVGFGTVCVCVCVCVFVCARGSG